MKERWVQKETATVSSVSEDKQLHIISNAILKITTPKTKLMPITTHRQLKLKEHGLFNSQSKTMESACGHGNATYSQSLGTTLRVQYW